MSRRLLKNGLKYLVRRNGFSLSRVDDLTYLADKFGSDKGTLFSAHGYTRVYGRLFERIRADDVVFLEMGLLRPDLDGRRPGGAAEGSTAAIGVTAPSLEMWHTFSHKVESMASILMISLAYVLTDARLSGATCRRRLTSTDS